MLPRDVNYTRRYLVLRYLNNKIKIKIMIVCHILMYNHFKSFTCCHFFLEIHLFDDVHNIMYAIVMFNHFR